MTRTATTTIRRTTNAEATSQTYEQLVRHAHTILSACGRSMSANKVCKVVRQYQRHVKPNGWVFWDFMANAMLLTGDQRSVMATDYDVYKTICYLDTVGETAVDNVTRQRGY